MEKSTETVYFLVYFYFLEIILEEHKKKEL